MMRIARGLWLCGALACLLASGCQTPTKQMTAREEATERWRLARADVKARLADAQLAAGRVDAASAELDEALRLDPDDPRLQLLEARVLLARGDANGAERLLDAIIPDKDTEAERHYLLGIVYQERLEWDPALQQFRAALECNGDEVAYLAAAVQVELQVGQANEALALLDKNAPRLGWTSAYHAAAAECHEQLDDWEAATGEWARVADARDDASINERLALAAYRAGQWTRAIPVLQHLLDERTDAQPGLRMILAECLLETSDADAAREQLSFVLRERPRDIHALTLLARALAEQGQYERGLRIAEEALVSNTGDRVELAELAAALALRINRYDRARAWAEFVQDQSTGAASDVVARVLRICDAHAE